MWNSVWIALILTKATTDFASDATTRGFVRVAVGFRAWWLNVFICFGCEGGPEPRFHCCSLRSCISLGCFVWPAWMREVVYFVFTCTSWFFLSVDMEPLNKDLQYVSINLLGVCTSNEHHAWPAAYLSWTHPGNNSRSHVSISFFHQSLLIIYFNVFLKIIIIIKKITFAKSFF